MNVFAVIDTNVIVSALLARNPETATVKVLEAFFQGHIVPLVNDEIMNEYADVLRRPKSDFLKSWWVLSYRRLMQTPSVQDVFRAKRHSPTLRMRYSTKWRSRKMTPISSRATPSISLIPPSW